MAQKQYLIEYLSSGQISQRNTNFQVLWVKKKSTPTFPSEFSFFLKYSETHTATKQANFLRFLLEGFRVFGLGVCCDWSPCVDFQAFAWGSAYSFLLQGISGIDALNFQAENKENLLFFQIYICLMCQIITEKSKKPKELVLKFGLNINFYCLVWLIVVIL